MSADVRDTTNLGDRLARMRWSYGESIDLPNLGRLAFATLIGISPIKYEAYERGDQVPSADFLAALHRKTGTSLV
jgi:transcriptional regulator with XRE-family HTH domain